jgi:NTP pyrophosphatase (non-canonical NTP hydrolase)
MSEANELEAIRARHEACGHVDQWPDYDSFMAHTDRATLLRLLDAARAELAFMRPEVREFARLMEEKLRANDHKPGWRQDDPEELVNRIEQETNELRQAVCRAFGEAHWPLREGEYRPHKFASMKWRSATKEERAEWSAKIPGEAADVANFAMMVADVVKPFLAAALKDLPTPPQTEQKP